MDARYQEAMDRAFQHLHETFVIPEISARKAKGSLPDPFVLVAAQVIMYPDRRPYEVRLNSEVRAVASPIFKPGVAPKELNEVVLMDEIEGFHWLELTDAEDPNCGHATFIRVGPGRGDWFWSFDFRYNRGHARRHYEGAKQFLSCAEVALQKGHLFAFVDNLFSCVELTAKIKVLSHADPKFVEHTNHKAIWTRFSAFAHPDLGNVPSEQREAFKTLSNMRSDARYDQQVALTKEQAAQLFQIVSKMLDDAAQEMSLI